MHWIIRSIKLDNLNDFGVKISSLKAVLESGDMSQVSNNDSGSYNMTEWGIIGLK